MLRHPGLRDRRRTFDVRKEAKEFGFLLMTSVGLRGSGHKATNRGPVSPETEVGAADRESRWVLARSELVMTSDSS